MMHTRLIRAVARGLSEVTGCTRAKSANPLSPDVAEPIPGVHDHGARADRAE